MKILKRVIAVGLLLGLIFGGKYFYKRNLNHNLEEITENKVYKSGVIPPDEIADYIKEYNIKTVIDLRHGGVGDKLNPEAYADIKAEKEVVEAIEGVNYVNIPSVQIPTEENLQDFFTVLDKPESYPVLMHCYHGTGRAMIYSAIYRIEYEGMDKTEARSKTRPFFSLPFSSFAEDKPKGKYLEEYKKRSNK
ncbi:dual specificity protein phosphatase family protein [Pseudofulvibacter geojedonensis]|uniref:Dual specificity protein phosphatase family protein n=1 Tax=Pseudofulvibacter geojedonensis TaxID=1123758 RepID=A0ABW3I220_9FLAO